MLISCACYMLTRKHGLCNDKPSTAGQKNTLIYLFIYQHSQLNHLAAAEQNEEELHHFKLVSAVYSSLKLYSLFQKKK